MDPFCSEVVGVADLQQRSFAGVGVAGVEAVKASGWGNPKVTEYVREEMNRADRNTQAVGGGKKRANVGFALMTL